MTTSGLLDESFSPWMTRVASTALSAENGDRRSSCWFFHRFTGVGQDNLLAGDTSLQESIN